ncbi:kelch-like protein 9 [Elgaria multicarinata webbii]|uniref:kelch-like protein 9 n=1 Tax=Elgaria multicarinata webbii TaxID=159646 RepID=UPI002FCCCABD
MALSSHAWARGQCLSSETYLPKLLEALGSLRSQEALCDVTLEAGGGSFPAHKAILAAASSYCKVRFMRDAASRCARLKLASVTARGLQNVLAFVYSNQLELTLQTVEETFKAAEALLVREVMSLCFRFLEEGLNRHTCLDVLNLAKRLGPEDLKQKAMRCVSRHCCEILADPSLLKGLDRATLCEVLDSADIEELSELELFQAAMRWVRYNGAPLNHAADIFKRIRFPLIPLCDLQRFVLEVPVMKTEPACRRHLQEAFHYHSQLYAQPVLQSERTMVRAGTNALLIIGGRSADNAICGHVWATDQSCRTWKNIGKLHGPVYNHCVAVIHNFVFVMGGQDRFDPSGQCPSNKVFRFDPRHDMWLQVASMLARRTRFHAAALNDRLVAVGGGALLGALTDTAEEYHPAENEWRPIAPFPMPVADHAGATHKGILYVSGGFAEGKTLRDTYSYLSRLRRWIRNRPMSFARCDHGMATVGDRIFCIGGRAQTQAEEWAPVNEAEYYCPVTDQWTLLSLSAFDLCQFGLAEHQLQLYITGGGSLRRRSKEDGVFVCKPGGKAWEKAGSLPTALADHACCFVRLPRRITGGRRQDGEGPSAPGRKKSTLNLFVTNKYSPQPAP